MLVEKRDNMTLSPSQQTVLRAIQKNPIRYLPKGAELDCSESLAATLTILGCRWEWSRTIDLEANTSDYRRRIWEINQMDGYKIIAFHAPWTTMHSGGSVRKFTRHGYILIPPNEKGER